MADPLIHTKLRLPFTRPELVRRPRLQKQIMQGLRGPLTLITAPAGFGKTTLVASCVADCDHPVAWFSLDKDDNQTSHFLNYLVAALQEIDHSIGSEAVQLLAASHQVPPEVILTSLINDLDTAGREISLVLDDYHFINNQAVHAAVAFLLDHCPRAFHLVITSRSNPPLPVSRLRARGQTVELRAADLSFTEVEAAQFLNDVMGLQLDAGSVAVLEKRTEGWIVGLQMAALSIRDREDTRGFIEGFSGTHRHILDYLLEEVLARESEDVQTFLLQTAILTRLTGPLCDAVIGASGSQEMLERLERRNLFVVPLDDDRRWYRYHHLFADLLQARLRQSGPGRVAELLSRAAGWCEVNGQIVEAVSYAFAAQDYERAAGLVARYWGVMTNNGQIETLWSWLDALPDDTIRNSAPLSVAYCWALWFRAHLGLFEEHLAHAERAVSEAGIRPDSEPYGDLPAQLDVLRSFVARYHDDFESSIALAQRALSLIPGHLSAQDDAQLRSLAFTALAAAYDSAGDLEEAAGAYAETLHWSRIGTNAVGVTGITYRMIGVLRLLGRLREADEVCRETLDYIQAQGMTRLPAAGILHLAMSEVLVEQNNLETAQERLSQGIELGKWSGRLNASRNAVHALARLRQARHDPGGALVAVRESEVSADERLSPLARGELLSLKARILTRQGALDEAAQCAEEAVRLVGGDRGQTGQMVALASARVMIAQGEPSDVIPQLAQSIAQAEADRRMGVVIELCILRSLALARQGDRREAEADLERALALAAPEGYVRVFLDEGQPMQMLIAQWLAHADPGTLRDYAFDLLSQFDIEQEEASPAGDLAEPLTERELEVLHIMAMGKTNQEIAQLLVVARGTIKAHTASIYRKLDVTNRTEAVARARQLGILP